jgi:hypothetical protein
MILVKNPICHNLGHNNILIRYHFKTRELNGTESQKFQKFIECLTFTKGTNLYQMLDIQLKINEVQE